MIKETLLKSKRNKVYLVESHEIKYIKKVFFDKENMLTEQKILLKMDGNFSPKLYKAYDLTIEKEYIEGIKLIDYILNEDNDIKKAAKLLSNFLFAFHNLNEGKTLSDVNFNNFIIKDEHVYCIDYEEIERGNLSDALARVLAFSENYSIKESKKKEFSVCLLENSDIEFKDIEEKFISFEGVLKARRQGQKTNA